MHIGLIGGIGPAATDFYHRGLIERHHAANIPLDDLPAAYPAPASAFAIGGASRNVTMFLNPFAPRSTSLPRQGFFVTSIASISSAACAADLSLVP